MTMYRVTSEDFGPDGYVLLKDLSKSGDDYMLGASDVSLILEKWRMTRKTGQIRRTTESARSVAVYCDNGSGDLLEIWVRKAPSNLWLTDECPFELIIELDDPPRPHKVAFTEVSRISYFGTVDLTDAEVKSLVADRTLVGDIDHDRLDSNMHSVEIIGFSVSAEKR